MSAMLYVEVKNTIFQPLKSRIVDKYMNRSDRESNAANSSTTTLLRPYVLPQVNGSCTSSQQETSATLPLPQEMHSPTTNAPYNCKI